MKTIKDVFISFKESLSGVYEAAEIEALTLLTGNELLGLSKASIKAFPEKLLTEQQSSKLDETLAELKTGKPLQYILGRTEFYGLQFLVNPTVLIPRPETEELVEWIIGSVGSSLHILDVGTGSGCIAVGLKKNLPGAKVSAIDISEDALETAKQNAELNGIDVTFINADIFNIQTNVENEKYDIIVSNPPYVTLEDKTMMHTNVIDFEPHTALFVPEHDPLIFYKAIAKYASNNLTDNGLLFFEINESYGTETADLLIAGGFTDVELRKDMSGRDRMIKAVYQKK